MQDLTQMPTIKNKVQNTQLNNFVANESIDDVEVVFYPEITGDRDGEKCVDTDPDKGNGHEYRKDFLTSCGESLDYFDHDLLMGKAPRLILFDVGVDSLDVFVLFKLVGDFTDLIHLLFRHGNGSIRDVFKGGLG